MHAAFAEQGAGLDPPSGAVQETLDDVQRAMREGGAVLAWMGAEAAGSARFRIAADHLYVGRLSVPPPLRGRGIARAMMTFLERHAADLELPKVRLGVRLSIPRNFQLYSGLGYQVVERQRHPGGTDEVAWMEKRLAIPSGRQSEQA